MNEFHEDDQFQMIQRAIERTKSNGRRIFETTQDFFARNGVASEVFRDHKIIALDVYRGPEIVAWSSYQPSELIASESLALLDDPQDRSVSAAVLHTLAQEYQATVIEASAEEAITTLISRESTVGLITHLNMFPDQIDTQYIQRITEASLPQLVPNGIVLFTIQEPEELGVLQQVLPLFSADSTIARSFVAPILPHSSGVFIAAPGTYGLVVQKA